MEFNGAKVALFLGADLLVIRRDSHKPIPFPGHLDFPGGGREDDESPQDCVIRETLEELGLGLKPSDIVWSRQYDQNWFFVAQRPPTDRDQIVFGDEGQGWQMMTPKGFEAHPLAVPHLITRLQDYLADTQH
ncbi:MULTISPECIES: NUDIX hydrolase [unclassified Ruegeria]|uniref:NUDIX hydrolase n=1 Tax=unclassified Ruegeria TaxID=2625375 RepID=UPI001487CCA3|nr:MULTISPECIES: NUDIX hydrolase [unclassified Ruegeria]